MTEAETIIADLKRLEPQLREKGVTHLAIFGSRARGDNRPDSDLDVVLDVDEASKFSLITLAGVKIAIEDALPLTANVITRRSLPDRFQDRIRDDERAVF
jgi:uncharacterized protein